MAEIKCQGCAEVFSDTPASRETLDENGWDCPQCGGHVIFWPVWRGSKGLELVAAERKGHIEREGWRPEHDAEHVDGELAWAATCYTAPATILVPAKHYSHTYVDPWPWSPKWDGRKTIRTDIPMTLGQRRRTRIRELVKGASLAVAEIDRLLALPEPLDPASR